MALDVAMEMVLVVVVPLLLVRIQPEAFHRLEVMA
jgi:hypothetical protein